MKLFTIMNKSQKADLKGKIRNAEKKRGSVTSIYDLYSVILKAESQKIEVNATRF